MDSKNMEKLTIDAILNDDINEFVKLIKNFKDWKKYFIPNVEEYFINTAIKKKAFKIIDFMIDQKININFTDKTGKNSLHLSIELGLCNISKKILTIFKSEILFTEDEDRNNELHKWVLYHSTCEKCLKSLSDFRKFKNEYFNSKNLKNNNALHQAVIDEDKTAVMYLTSGDYFNFYLNELGEDDNTLLHLSAANKDPEIFFYFYSLNKIDPNLKNKKLQTSLTVSLINENYAISDKLIEDGVRITSSDKRIAFEKTSTIYPKIKSLYDSQQRESNPSSFKRRDLNFSQYSNAEVKSVVIYDEETQKKFINSSVRKNKQSHDMRSIFKVNDINLDTNSNSSNSNYNEENKGYSNSNKLSLNSLKNKKFLIESSKKINENLKKDSDLRTPITPFPVSVNSYNKLKKPDTIVLTYQSKDNHQTPLISNSPLKQNNIQLKVPITGTGTLTSNFFLNSYLNDNLKNNIFFLNTNSNTNSNKFLSNEYVCKRISPYLNNNFNFDSVINFEYVKSFTALDLKDLKLDQKIHSGEISDLFKGKYLALPVAIKIYSIAKLKEDDLKYFISEVNLLMSLRHPYIVTFLGTCFNKTDFYIVTEYLERKSLKSVLENKNINLTTLDKLKICYEISIAIYYLHSRKPQVFHRDLKSSNCLVDNYNRVKLCDFGLSKIYEDLKTRLDINKDLYRTNCTSTSFWMAPEFINNKLFTDKADIYALGILIWEIIMRDPVPYKGLSEIAFLCGDKEILQKRPEIPRDLDPEIKNLMEICWHHDYNHRPDISIVVDKLETLINFYKN